MKKFVSVNFGSVFGRLRMTWARAWSLTQSGCHTPFGCSYGGQQSFAVSYHLQKETRLYAETFDQNTAQSNRLPGTYLFGGSYHQFNDAFGIDGGLRIGVSDHSAKVGTTIGLVWASTSEVSPCTSGQPSLDRYGK
jgi:hypothetical protein